MVDEVPNYILLPSIGFLDPVMRDLERPKPFAAGGMMPNSVRQAVRALKAEHDIEVIDRVAEDGPKLVAMSAITARELRKVPGGFLVAPLRRYRPAVRPMRRIRAKGLFASNQPRTRIRVFLREKSQGTPVKDAVVIAVLKEATSHGLRRRSTAHGQVTLTFPGTTTRIERLFVYPPSGVWGYYGDKVTLLNDQTIDLNPIDLRTPDVLQSTYAKRSHNRGTGANVRVAVIDTGVDGHADLRVSGGWNFADGQPIHYSDVTGHGTHVAGIIAGRGAAGTGMRGIAPDVELMSYRVFPSGGGTASNINLMKAIYKAVQDGCDLINMSLGGGPVDVALNRAIGYAFEQGVVCVAAAGNEGGKPVTYPAWYKRALAVSALGCHGTFPPDSVERADVTGIVSSIHNSLFLAAFSNIGSEIDFIAPGVGVVSTAPGGAYAVQSGTSMACPIVTGAAAVRLSAQRRILTMSRDIRRAHAIVEMIRGAAIPQGFEPTHEGFGQPAL